MATGIVALSFAKRVEEPNPVNIRLASITDDIIDDNQLDNNVVVVVAQWEIARALIGQPDLVVNPEDATIKGNGKRYLDSQDVLDKAFEEFRLQSITDVIVVANNFIHRGVVESMVRKAGFNVLHEDIRSVGFDRSSENLQWWCKGPIRFMTYLGIQAFGKVVSKIARKDIDFHGIGEKPSTQ